MTTASNTTAPTAHSVGAVGLLSRFLALLSLTMVSLAPSAAVLAQEPVQRSAQSQSAAGARTGEEGSIPLETLTVRKEGDVLFAEIAAPP